MKKEFSKLILAWELAAVTAISLAWLYLAYISVKNGFTGSLPWVSTMITPAWAAYGVSKGFFTNKAKEENKIKIPALIERENKRDL